MKSRFVVTAAGLFLSVFLLSLYFSPPVQKNGVSLPGETGESRPVSSPAQQTPPDENLRENRREPRPQQVPLGDRSLQAPRPQPVQKTGKADQPAVPRTASNNDSSLTGEERMMVGLVNEERRKNGSAPLSVNSKLTGAARLKAKDMISNNYFSHVSPTYGSPFDMMRQFGISYRTAGENLAGAGSVDTAHNNLMNSPGHRSNILNKNYKEIGIGVVSGGPYGKMFVQLFTG